MTAGLCERWRPIPWAPRYDASSLGRVRSRVRRTPQILRPAVNSRGYAKVTLMVAGRRLQRYVHQLVMVAFVGPCPPGRQVDHINFRRTCNALSNLRYLRADVNRWRWRDDEVDPAELARVDALLEAAEAASARVEAWEAA